MSPVNEYELRRIDLNLLVVFSALMKERSVSDAAKRLHLGQPAVSAALRRLRELFADELFVRVARGMEPTRRALELAVRLEPLLMEIRETVLAAEHFSSATTQRDFRVCLSDMLDVWLTPTLVASIRAAAPKCQITVHSANGNRAVRLLEAEEVDVAVGEFQQWNPEQRHDSLLEARIVALMDQNRIVVPTDASSLFNKPRVTTPNAAFALTETEHSESSTGTTTPNRIEVSHVAMVPALLKSLDAVAFVPDYAARALSDQHQLQIVALADVAMSSVKILTIWSARADRDPANLWLREQITRCVRMLRESA